MSDKKKITFMAVKERETKNKVRFAEKDTTHMKMAYVSQESLKGIGNPDKVRITIEPA